MTDSNNKHLLEEEAKAFASSGRINYYDIVIDHGKGAVITDADGNDYIDLLASASSTNTGHAHPKVVKAIQDQAAKLIQYTPAYFANTQEARLAPRLAKLAPMSGVRLRFHGDCLALTPMMPLSSLRGPTLVASIW